MSATIQPIAGTEIFRLFPVSVCVVDLTAASCEAVGKAIDGVVPPADPDTSPDGRGDPLPVHSGLQGAAALAPLFDLFREQSRIELDRNHVQHGPLSIISCVAEQGTRGEGSAFRSIANAYLAGVYVARAPLNGCVLEFEDPRAQASILAPGRLSADVPDAPIVRRQVRAGALAIFPGYLRHRVVSDAHGMPHLVLRMGLMFQAFAETMARPKWQGNIQ